LHGTDKKKILRCVLENSYKRESHVMLPVAGLPEVDSNLIHATTDKRRRAK